MLEGIRPFVLCKSRVDPAGGNGVDPCFSGQTHGQGMGQRGNAPFGRRIALGLGLAHPVPGGCDVHHRGAGGKIRGQQLRQVKRRCDPHPQGVVELLIGTGRDPFHQGRRVVDQIVHPAVVGDDFPGKILQVGLGPQVAHKVVVGLLVDDAHMGPGPAELRPNGLADALGAAGDDGHSVGEHGLAPFR